MMPPAWFGDGCRPCGAGHVLIANALLFIGTSHLALVEGKKRNAHSTRGSFSRSRDGRAGAWPPPAAPRTDQRPPRADGGRSRRTAAASEKTRSCANISGD